MPMTNLTKMCINHDVKGPHIPTCHRNLRSKYASKIDSYNISGECSPFSICLSRPYPLKYFTGYLPQILYGPLLNTLSHLF